MRSKGFTLVELLAVLAILAIISVLVFPNIAKTLDRSRNNAYNTQVVNIEMAAKSWATDNIELLDPDHLNDNYINVEFLKHEGYLEYRDIQNPITKDNMEGCIAIVYDEVTNQYTALYSDLSCADYTASIDAHGTIRTIVSNEVKTEEVNLVTSAFNKVLEDNPSLYSNSNTSDGLYKISDNYIFRGTNPNNYLKIGSTNFRIIDMDSDGVRLIKTTGVTTSYGNSEFLSSSVAASLLSELSSFDEDIQNRLVNMNLYVGEVGTSGSLNLLESLEKSKSITNNTGLINISDYVNASVSSACRSDFTSAICTTNNYLYEMFTTKSVWTQDVDGANRWAIINGIPESHVLNEQADILFNAYLVIKVNNSMYIESGMGTLASPYILK